MWLMPALLGALLGVLTLHRRQVYTLPSSTPTYGELAGKTMQNYLAMWEATLRRTGGGWGGSHTEEDWGTLRRMGAGGTLSCLGRSLTPQHQSYHVAIFPLVLCIPQTIHSFLGPKMRFCHSKQRAPEETRLHSPCQG